MPEKGEKMAAALPKKSTEEAQVSDPRSVDYVARVITELYADRRSVRGLRAVNLPAELAIFTATLAPA